MIALRSDSPVAAIVPKGVHLFGGTVLPASLIVYAAGYGAMTS